MSTSRNYERELKQLYARRLAIDSLIASLQTYDRYRTNTSVSSTQHRKSA